MIVPEVIRKRKKIEFTSNLDIFGAELQKRFMVALSEVLRLHIFYGPVVFSSPTGTSGFVGWRVEESGCQIHSWRKYGLMCIDIFSCLMIDEKAVLDLVYRYFKPVEIEVSEG